MKLKEKIHNCNYLSDLPDEKLINSIQRGIRYKVIFSSEIKNKKNEIGEKWKIEFPNHQIAIHTINHEISIVKLITDLEIEENQDFFEQCAKDYRQLANKLIWEFAEQNKLEIKSKYPMDILNASGSNGYDQIGMMNDWRYGFHGIHCAFTNLSTKQYIEVPLAFGLEFGELDPYFFSKYINSTNEYKPLPVYVYDDYWDGKRILDKMVQLGKFEIINSNMPNNKGVVVKDRNKVAIHTYEEVNYIPKEEINFSVNVKKKITIWDRIKSKWKK